MNEKIVTIEFTQEELEALYNACLQHREELYSIAAKLGAVPEARIIVEAKTDVLTRIISKVTSRMEE